MVLLGQPKCPGIRYHHFVYCRRGPVAFERIVIVGGEVGLGEDFGRHRARYVAL